MKSLIFLFLIFCLSNSANSQIIELKHTNSSEETKKDKEKPEATDIDYKNPETKAATLFEGGNIDFAAGGFLQTNPRLLRLNINLGKHTLPFYLLTSAIQDVSSNENDDKKSTTLNLFNPTAGYVNFGFHERILLYGKEKRAVAINYQLSGKVVSGNEINTDNSLSMFSIAANVGLTFQAPAELFNANGIKNDGLMYATFNLAYSSLTDEKMDMIYGPGDHSGNFMVFKFAGGLEIDEFLKIKVAYSKNIKSKELIDDLVDNIVTYTMEANF